jgi:hypothetical protein
MTGLDLETFLRLLRVDVGAWISLGVIIVLLILMTWTSFGSRKALAKCLVLSVIVHIGLVLGGGNISLGIASLNPGADPEVEHIREIRVLPRDDTAEPSGDPAKRGTGGRRLADWDRPGLTNLPEERAVRPDRPETAMAPMTRPVPGESLPEPDAAEVEPSAPEPNAPVGVTAVADPPEPTPLPVESTPVDMAELPSVAIDPRDEPAEVVAIPKAGGGRLRPNRGASPDATANTPTARAPRPPLGPDLLASSVGSPERRHPEDEPLAAMEAEPSIGAPSDLAPEPPLPPTEPIRPAPGSTPAPVLVRPDSGTRLRPNRMPTSRPGRGVVSVPVPIAGVTPTVPINSAPLADARPLPEVPEVYRPRLDPNRSAIAQRAGASRESELAVERALLWLAKHQDKDGRWDAAIGAPGDDDFTVHCPPGDICSGPCYYWEADTAMTGLALLTYLGAGYTHRDGKHAATVDKGLRFLLATQKPDGDLRGESVAVGMYCHAMASLALCEAYALTGDPALRGPVERAVSFIVKARATDHMAWRYEPRARSGDTSILGWIILVLKSAKETGIAVPSETRSGAIRWLTLVSEGRRGGLAMYRPNEKVTPTMTAEAWVCRQFLGVGGPGPASEEAAAYLLQHGPDRDPFNLYYWYYGTLSMYQHGGDDWERWNAVVRDRIVSQQRNAGHQAGSWDPDDSEWGTRGGRIYCTALATLTLEVYYRYLRLYDDPSLPPTLAPGRPDPPVRRAGTVAPGS